MLVLVFAAVEAVHVHSYQTLSRHSGTSCLICISTHANVPTVNVDSLPVSFAVAAMVVPYAVEVKGIASRLELFIRPPPSV
ncbi:MAG TPA: hypothetical protein VJA94_04975 [Candidatus Angelobacter sp.]